VGLVGEGREGRERFGIENEARHGRGKVLVRRKGMEMKGKGEKTTI
jgi:hypothetical protein